MQHPFFGLSRRQFMRLLGPAGAGITFGIACDARRRTHKAIPLFDGRTLRGWKQIQNSADSLSASQISDPAAFIHEIDDGGSPLSIFLRSRLEPAVKASLDAYSASAPNAKQVLSVLVKNLNQIVAGPPIYSKTRFANGITLRPETGRMLRHDPQGFQLAELNKLLIEDAYPALITTAPLSDWTVKDGAMASIGSGRGVIYTERDFSRFRLMFTMRHLSGKPDHQACVLIFCTRPQDDEKPLDALGGIQFQVPNGGHWDYRPGSNTSGGPEFTSMTKTKFNPHEWSRVEILADATQGTARMAVAQPPGSNAVEVLDFRNPSAGKIGPIAWQMHNAGLLDEYKEVTVEIDPGNNELIAVA